MSLGLSNLVQIIYKWGRGVPQGSSVLLSCGCCLRESGTRRGCAGTRGNVWDRRSRSRLDLESEVLVCGRAGCAWTGSVALGAEKPLSSLSALSFYLRSWFRY